MENRRMRKQEKHKILCALHRIDFENIDNEVLCYGSMISDHLDLGLALHDAKERINEINKHLDNNYIVSVIGYYKGKQDLKYTYHADEVTLDLVKWVIREVTI